MNVLITGASGAQAYKLEKEISETHNIIFADSVDLPAVMLKSRKFIKIPEVSSASFSHQLLTTCLDLDIRRVFPLRKLEIRALAEARQLFDEYGIRVMVPAQEDLDQYFGTYKTGTVVIKDTEQRGAQDQTSPTDRGAFLFNTGAEPEFQILTVD
ncbi:hypothetical protein [Desertivirga xinjiangensis]|uniref:hypothetical protein n=1 Tax=Desertivirga xinjiangensis TaxID=539206 RepID=UPI002108E7C4|nr:hypothetical protein [Pedobacter xinjiangensis]